MMTSSYLSHRLTHIIFVPTRAALRKRCCK